MKTHTFSIVVGNEACNANCPYCVSKMTCRAKNVKQVNWQRFDTACQVAQQAGDGLVSVLLTGKGEPTLYPATIYDYLCRMDQRFPLVDLQTNGVLLKAEQLRSWSQMGLTLVCLSIAHYDANMSNQIMGINGRHNFWQKVDMIHEAGLAVRLNCTMLKDAVCTPVEFECLVARAKEHGVEQLTLREVERPRQVEDGKVADYVDEHKPRGAASALRNYILASGGTELLQLPHGADVFDFLGQNVCISNCLTSTTDPSDIRQIIFFPEGRIAYDWQYAGARIL